MGWRRDLATARCRVAAAMICRVLLIRSLSAGHAQQAIKRLSHNGLVRPFHDRQIAPGCHAQWSAHDDVHWCCDRALTPPWTQAVRARWGVDLRSLRHVDEKGEGREAVRSHPVLGQVHVAKSLRRLHRTCQHYLHSIAGSRENWSIDVYPTPAHAAVLHPHAR